MAHLIDHPFFWWPGGCVPYEFSDDFSPARRARATWAMQEIASHSRFRFIPRKPYHQDYVRFDFVPGTPGCNSPVGRKWGPQFIRCGTGWQLWTFLHDVMHACGFYHEHQRCDALSFVSPNPDSDLAVEEGPETCEGRWRSSVYDFASIMHKNGDAFTPLPGGSPIGAPSTPGTLNGDPVAFPQMSQTDRAGFSHMSNGHCTLMQMNTDGTHQRQIRWHKWSDGWTTAATYTAGTRHYLFLYKADTGEMHVNRINHEDGTIGDKIQDETWGSNWDNVTTFRHGGGTFLFLLKSSTGAMHVNKVNSDGTIGSVVHEAYWQKGWTSARVFNVRHQYYLFLLKRSTGLVHINKIKWSGKIGPIKHRHRWRSGWTIARPFSLAWGAPGWEGKNYLFLLKSGTGDVHVNKIKDNGSIGKRVFDSKWSKGWTQAEIFGLGANKHLYLLKRPNERERDGRVHVNRIGPGGIIAEIRDRRIFGHRFDTIVPYDPDRGLWKILLLSSRPPD